MPLMPLKRGNLLGKICVRINIKSKRRLTVVISEAQHVFLAVLVGVRRRRVAHPGADAEAAHQRVRQDGLGHHGRGALAVELEHLLAVAT